MVTFIILSTLLSLVENSIGSHWLSASDGKCQFTLSNELIISFSEYPSLFINKFKKKDLAECHAACCLHETCNGYVWDALDTDNCKLLKCSMGGEDCKSALTSSNGVTIGEVGFITGLNQSPAKSTTTTATTAKPRTVANVSTHVPVVLENNNKKSNIISNSLAWLSQHMKGNHTASTNSTTKLSKTHQHKASDQAINASNPGLGFTTKKRISNNNVGDEISKVPTPATRKTAVRILPNRSHKHDHTDSTSLTIALLFGVIFVVVVFVMLCRRWIEGIKDQQKRGYTRISYLLNGV